MARSRLGVSALVALLGLAAFAAAPADAKTKRRHHHPAPVHAHRVPAQQAFPVYLSKGVDRNPGGDDLYFNDTKEPNYLIGPGWFQRFDF